MKKGLIVLVLALLPLSVTTCTKKHVGKSIAYDNPIVCKCVDKPCACTIGTEHFDFTFQVEHVGHEEYTIKGQAVNVSSTSASRISGGTFSFLLVKANQIIDSITVTSKGSLQSPSIALTRRFQCAESFDAVAATYDLQVK